LVESKGAGQNLKSSCKTGNPGDSDAEKFPIQTKNKPSLDYLRENAHLRVRTNMFGAIMRVRSVLSFAVQLFSRKGFV
jgi:asparaginyl-tRNA synthetase